MKDEAESTQKDARAVFTHQTSASCIKYGHYHFKAETPCSVICIGKRVPEGQEMLPCSPEGGVWGREGTPLSLGSSLGGSWSSWGRLGLHHGGGTEADFGHHNASVRSGPLTMSASACLYVHINTTRFGQGRRNHPAFNYRNTGTWETAEKIISLACFTADEHSALAIPKWASGNVNRHIFGMPLSPFWMVSAF